MHVHTSLSSAMGQASYSPSDIQKRIRRQPHTLQSAGKASPVVRCPPVTLPPLLRELFRPHVRTWPGGGHALAPSRVISTSPPDRLPPATYRDGSAAGAAASTPGRAILPAARCLLSPSPDPIPPGVPRLAILHWFAFSEPHALSLLTHRTHTHTLALTVSQPPPHPTPTQQALISPPRPPLAALGRLLPPACPLLPPACPLLPTPRPPP